MGRNELLTLSLIFLTTGTASAARVRFHYAAPPNGGGVALVPFAPQAPGERISVFGREPYYSPPPPATCVVSFRHSFSGSLITVPLGLPADTPTIQHRGPRVIYNYGSYMVEVHFLPDGSVDVIYSNGLLRDI